MSSPNAPGLFQAVFEALVTNRALEAEFASRD